MNNALLGASVQVARLREKIGPAVSLTQEIEYKFLRSSDISNSLDGWRELAQTFERYVKCGRPRYRAQAGRAHRRAAQLERWFDREAGLYAYGREARLSRVPRPDLPTDEILERIAVAEAEIAMVALQHNAFTAEVGLAQHFWKEEIAMWRRELAQRQRDQQPAPAAPSSTAAGVVPATLPLCPAKRRGERCNEPIVEGLKYCWDHLTPAQRDEAYRTAPAAMRANLFGKLERARADLEACPKDAAVADGRDHVDPTLESFHVRMDRLEDAYVRAEASLHANDDRAALALQIKQEPESTGEISNAISYLNPSLHAHAGRQA